MNEIDPRILAIALNCTERALIARALEELIAREGESVSARSVLEMLQAPLEVGQLAMFSDEALVR